MSYKTFDEVREFLSGIEYIHDGGCGVSALAMYRWLKKNHTEKQMASIKFVYIEYDEDMIYEHKENLAEGYWIDAPCHCVLLYKGELIDAEGYVDVNEWGDATLEISDEQVIVDSLVNGCWNSCFDREKWIPIIEKELGIDLSDVLDGEYFD
jgi:hypothetical protein